MTCATCPFFASPEAVKDHGECRADKPIITAPNIATGVWPVVNANAWCGRHPERMAHFERVLEGARGALRQQVPSEVHP